MFYSKLNNDEANDEDAVSQFRRRHCQRTNAWKVQCHAVNAAINIRKIETHNCKILGEMVAYVYCCSV